MKGVVLKLISVFEFGEIEHFSKHLLYLHEMTGLK
jgi:hypothetical protein